MNKTCYSHGKHRSHCIPSYKNSVYSFLRRIYHHLQSIAIIHASFPKTSIELSSRNNHPQKNTKRFLDNLVYNHPHKTHSPIPRRSISNAAPPERQKIQTTKNRKRFHSRRRRRKQRGCSRRLHKCGSYYGDPQQFVDFGFEVFIFCIQRSFGDIIFNYSYLFRIIPGRELLQEVVTNTPFGSCSLKISLREIQNNKIYRTKQTQFIKDLQICYE